jgi:hypothetical protein
MKTVLAFLRKSFSKLWHSIKTADAGIDSHKWESKFEIIRSFRNY